MVGDYNGPVVPEVTITVDGKKLNIPEKPIMATNLNGYMEANHYQVYGPLKADSKIEATCENAKNAVKFLEGGDKVKVSIRFRGRQIAHSDIGMKVMLEFADRVKDLCTVERRPMIEGRNMIMILAPKAEKASKADKAAKAVKEQAQQA